MKTTSLFKAVALVAMDGVTVYFVKVHGRPRNSSLLLSSKITASSSSIAPAVVFLICDLFTDILFSFLMLKLSQLYENFNTIAKRSEQLYSVIYFTTKKCKSQLEYCAKLLYDRKNIIKIVTRKRMEANYASLNESVGFFCRRVGQASGSCK